MGGGVAVVLVLLIVLLYQMGRWWGSTGLLRATVSVSSTLDGFRYRVHPDFHDPGGAANMLADANRRVVELLRRLRRRYRTNHGPRGRATARLLERYNPDNLVENTPHDPRGDTSYTIGKGALVALCLREKDSRDSGRPDLYDLHDQNTTAFVVFHEMAHIATAAQGHPPEFWATFRFLLEEAVSAGVTTTAKAPRLSFFTRLVSTSSYPLTLGKPRVC